MNQPLEDEFYTVPEAARALRVSISTVWRWIDAGKLPALRVGQRGIRIRRQDLHAVVRPATEGKEAKKPSTREPVQIQMFAMSAAEVHDHEAVLERARTLQERILARRSGELLPASWQDLNEARAERSTAL